MIFINYRHSDAPHFAARLDASLSSKFGIELVFRDKTGMKGGEEWPKWLEKKASESSIMLVLIGALWDQVEFEEGRYKHFPRLQDPKDWVRNEIQMALRAKKPLVPLLLDGRSMPERDWLANFGLEELSSIQAITFQPDDYDVGLRKLLERVRELSPQLVRKPVAANEPGLRLFFNHLIDSHTQLFAGRDREREQVIDFMRSHQSGYIFVEGPSGYGKTSFLASLIKDNPRFTYHFISQSYKSSGAEFDPTQLESVLANICEQFGMVTSGVDVRTLRVNFQRLLSTPPASHSVLVIDAIDEVDRHPNYLIGLLPKRLPTGLIVILSARTQGERRYLQEVGLSDSDVGLTIFLPGLDEGGIRELLRKAGGRAEGAAAEAGFVAKLHQIVGGDPFYLRFLVEDVASARLTIRNIKDTPVGLGRYLDQQLSQLNRTAHAAQHRDILGLILAAHGALSRDDLLYNVPGLDGLNFDDVVRDIHRFLLVHQDQYTFCHPRFKEYFATKIR